MIMLTPMKSKKKRYREHSNVKARLSVDWLRLTGKDFQHPAGIKPKTPDLLQLVFTTKAQVLINQPKKTFMNHHVSQLWTE